MRIKALDMKHVAAIDDNIVRSTRGSIAFDEVHANRACIVLEAQGDLELARSQPSD